jgi:hypothetical protein
VSSWLRTLWRSMSAAGQQAARSGPGRPLALRPDEHIRADTSLSPGPPAGRLARQRLTSTRRERSRWTVSKHPRRPGRHGRPPRHHARQPALQRSRRSYITRRRICRRSGPAGGTGTAGPGTQQAAATGRSPAARQPSAGASMGRVTGAATHPGEIGHVQAGRRAGRQYRGRGQLARHVFAGRAEGAGFEPTRTAASPSGFSRSLAEGRAVGL